MSTSLSRRSHHELKTTVYSHEAACDMSDSACRVDLLAFLSVRKRVPRLAAHVQLSPRYSCSHYQTAGTGLTQSCHPSLLPAPQMAKRHSAAWAAHARQ